MKRQAKTIPPALNTSANGFPISGTVNASDLFIGELLPLLIVILFFQQNSVRVSSLRSAQRFRSSLPAFQWPAGY